MNQPATTAVPPLVDIVAPVYSTFQPPRSSPSWTPAAMANLSTPSRSSLFYCSPNLLSLWERQMGEVRWTAPYRRGASDHQIEDIRAERLRLEAASHTLSLTM
ncbi:hypothetical protein WUBG_03321 [Wuchereria bancrofti]|uniref:Uncharacterized protein n=1 Tax=Wuchereria bancrofti TaxID=6293 RepID=J9BEV4_WUCBA|nr:hypothetical protein WUBG_03321 [Wuchereria bancrofti]